MRLFVDSSVLLAACGRPTGAAYFVLMTAAQNGWHLYASDYVVSELGGSALADSLQNGPPGGPYRLKELPAV